MFRPCFLRLLRPLLPDMTWEMADRSSVYLTFDDGPTPGITEWILKTLAGYGVRATFFCLGKNVEQHPDLYRAIADAGHKVGNHSYSHIKGWGMATGQYVADVDLANQLVESDIFRPPYGRIRRPQLLQTLEAVGGDPQMLPGKGLEPAVPGLQRPVVQGGVGVVGGAAQALGGLEEGVVLIDVVVDDLALAPQGLHRPLRGAGLEQGSVVVDMVKGHKSDLQARDFLSLTSGPGWRPGPGAPAGRPR